MISADRIKFLSDGTWGVRPGTEAGKWELYFHSDPSEVLLVCEEKHIHLVAMVMNGLIEVRRSR